ncbi:exo-alpha-sialidase [Echinicola marina]|uniref:sialidase family protein n=1 Tax=Echinicola marina TaxID=2859768 RepID=UPI001CF6B63A|nr:sialidase family protein [Echinicola marina]UCS92060.1 exo-alpha-sialidase [Echinicola marina]
MIKHKEINSALLAGFLLFMFLTGCAGLYPSQENEIRVQAEQHYIPVLKGRNNDVVSLTFDLQEEQRLKELTFHIEGAHVLESLLVYEVTGEGKAVQRSPVAALVEVGKNAKIKLDNVFAAGSHKLLINVQPKEEASLLEQFHISPSKVAFEKAETILQPFEENRSFRLATSLRTAGDDGIAAYRIPGLATTVKGSLIAVYDARYNSSVDLQEDIDVGMSRSTDGGKSWEPMKIIMDMGEWGGKPQIENGIGDPAVLVDHSDNTIYVAALWAHGKPGERAWFSSGEGFSPEETGQLILVKSEDDGQTWSPPINITSQIKKKEWKLMFNGPGKGITMRDGTLVFAGQFKDENDMPHSTIIYSKDKGETWQIGTGAKSNTTEAQVVELNDGSLMLNMRDNRGGARSVSITKDMGKTWEEHGSSRSALPEPVCMASLITFPENRVEKDAPKLFFSNPAVTDGRYNMTIKESSDQGLTWSKGLLLDAGKGWGYSCLTVIDEDHLGILYESSQAHMTFQIIPIKELGL